MRLFHYAAYIIFAALPQAGFGQDACRYGVSDVFSVASYEVMAKESDFTQAMQLKLELVNDTSRGVRMVDGSIIFQDVLGRDILRIAVDPDLRIDAHGSAPQAGVYTKTRLLDVSKDDVVISTCIRGLVYSDGEVFKADHQ